MMANVLDILLKWLREVVPSLLAAFTFGFKAGAKKKEELEKEIIKLTFSKEVLENAERVAKEFDGLSDSDIVKNVSSGRKPTNH